MVAIICEFNPFHNGHKYILEKARGLTGEPVLAIMSGSFTQRGEPALCSKFERAKAALQNGADLVVELPAVYAVASAQRFALGGVNIAKAFGAGFLAFGCECDDLAVLQDAAGALKNPEVNEEIAILMKSGEYYPKAVEQAVRKICGGSVADVLTSPNNILAVEYLRALDGSEIKPLPVRRVATAHDSGETNGNFASASKIREMLRAGLDSSEFMPSVPSELTYSQSLERAILFKLRSMTADDFAGLPEVGEGLENRLLNAVKQYNSVEEIIAAVKTKRYTHARLRRIICCAMLGITEELQSKTAGYARVLGFTDDGAALLKNCACEVVTSVSKAMKHGGENALFLQKDVLATDLAALAYKQVKSCSADYLTKMLRKNRAK